MATTVNVHEAKTRLSELLAQAERGEEVIIARHGKPIAKLQRIDRKPRAKFGFAKDAILYLAEDFDAPDPRIEEMFYGAPLSSEVPAVKRGKTRRSGGKR